MRKTLYTIPGPKTIFEMTWQEVEEILKAGTKTVVLGVGATEQHGPRMPLGTDTLQVNEIAKRTVLKLDEAGYKAVAGPVVPFGGSVYHMRFPGTVTLSAATLKAVVKEVCQSLYHHGFDRFALILGHGGDYTAMMDAAQEMVSETNAQALVLNWVMAVREKYKTGDGHGGEIETSRIMATHPELVVPMKEAASTHGAVDKPAPRRKEASIPYSTSPLTGGGVFRAVKDFGEVTNGTGYTGDPSLATVEKGEDSLEIAADWLKEVIISQWGK